MGKIDSIKQLVVEAVRKDGCHSRLNSKEIAVRIRSLHPDKDITEKQVEEFLNEQFYDTKEGEMEDYALEARRLYYLEGFM